MTANSRSGIGETCDRCAELEREVAQLKHAVSARELVGQATGIVMATRQCSAEEAIRTLVTVSQHRNRKLREIAAELVAMPRGGAGPSRFPDAVDVRRSELTVRLETDARGGVVRVDGDLDGTTVAQLEQAVAIAPAGPLRVNLRDLAFADARGFAPLLEAARTGRQVSLEHTPRFARRLLELLSPPASLIVDETTSAGSRRA